MADNKIELEIVLDDGSIKRAFATVKKEGDDTAKGLGNSFKVNGLADFTAGLYLVQRAASAVGDALKKAFDLTIEGEKIAAVGKRFEILSSQAGLSASVIEDGIKAAVDGTVDLDNALQEASKSLITLGPNAAKIPELFELARKSAQGFGGTTIENFEKLSQAVASGNTRILRSIGLNIDADKAVKDYEKSLGAAAGGLTEAGKQQAILNAALEKGEKSFKNINGSITPLAEDTQRLATSFKSFEDSIASVFNKFLSGTLRSSLNTLSLSFRDLSNDISSAFLNQAAPIESQISKLEAQLLRLNEMKILNPNQAAEFEAQASSIEEQLIKITQRQQMQEAARAQAASQTKVDNNELLVQTLALTDAQNAQNATIDAYENLLKKEAAAVAATAQQINMAVKSAIVNGIGKSIEAMVNALMNGENALSAIGKAILGVFADLAVQLGYIFITTGIGMLALEGLSAFEAIAAGAGLVAVGTLLKGLIGGGGSGNAGVTSNGGGVAFTGDSQTLVQQNQEEQLQREANTAVQVTIMGDVLDSDATGTRIVSLLNDAFDKQGVVVRGATA